MTESCKTCKNRLDLEKWDFQDQGVPKTKYDGFACLAFASEGLVVHLVGVDEDKDTCECYSEKI